jgi:hypothetical protein
MGGLISLDGIWDFMHAGTEQTVQVRRAHVPSPWQAQFPDLRMKAGVGIYRRRFDVPRGWRDGQVHVCFGAVFHNTRVWINDHLAGGNEGGFLPFSLDVSDSVVEGQNEIKVRVESPTDDTTLFPDEPFGEIPFGKQSWYGPLSGIWQSVHLVCRNVDHVSDFRIWPRLENGTLDVRVLLGGPATMPLLAELHVIDHHGTIVARHETDIAAGIDEIEAHGIVVPAVRPWSPDDPRLYRLRVALCRKGEVLDSNVRTFGFRTFEARDGRFYLNGKPFHLRAALDQDYYPDTICTLPSAEFAEDQFRKAKALGLNCVRLHIKVPDPRYLDAADRVGILVWAELPNGGVSTERSRARKEALLKGLVDRDRHHPSIVIWTIINENWGVDLVHDQTHRAWLKRTFDWLKNYDTTRLVVDNSPLYPSFHLKTDIADYHFYAAIPDSRALWDKFVDDLADRGDFLFSPDGDAETTGKEPLMCSEFGNWGLPNPRLLAGPDGREPWWFETGHDWGGGVMYPHGIEHRFIDWHLDRVFGDLDAMIEATQWHQFVALKYQIERLRLRPEIAGYVVTELTDVHWEANGLMDMRRHPRVFHDAFRHFNADTVVVARLERWSYWAGESITFPVSVLHAAGPTLDDLRLEIRVPGRLDPITFELPRLVAGESARIDVGLDLPEAPAARRSEVTLSLMSGGREVARNWSDIAIHPPRRSGGPRPSVWTADADLAIRFERLGYRPAASAEVADLIVATGFDPALAGLVREGKRLLLLAETKMSLYPFFPHWQAVAVEERSGTPWQGDWASSFSWLQRQGPFAELPGGPLLDLAFDRVVPRHVITGCNRIDFQGRVHAGLVVGWVHKPVAFIVERGYGNGRFVATTFRLQRDEPGADPTATLLLDGLVARALAGQTRLTEIDEGPMSLAG